MSYIKTTVSLKSMSKVSNFNLVTFNFEGRSRDVNLNVIIILPLGITFEFTIANNYLITVDPNNDKILTIEGYKFELKVNEETAKLIFESYHDRILTFPREHAEPLINKCRELADR